MGKRYLDTKKDSLESSILGVWQTAVEEKETRVDGRTKQYKEHRAKLEAARKTRLEKLVGGQKKLDKDKDGDIDGKDFAMMRKKKNEEYHRYLETKKGSLRDAILQMWGEEVKDDKKTLTKEKKDGKNKMTDTGKNMTPVDMAPKMPKIKNEKNKV